MSYTKYTEEILTPIVSGCYSLAGVLRSLGLRQTGGSQSNIKHWIKIYSLDTSHFLGQKHNTGARHKGGEPRRTPDEILVLRDPLRRPEQAVMLRRAMLEIGVKFICSVCLLPPEWQSKPLKLQIDHINGQKHDNRRENLRFICPNCHSQTDTFCKKNKPS